MADVAPLIYVLIAVAAIVAVIAAYRLDEHRNSTGRGLWGLTLDRLAGAPEEDGPGRGTRLLVTLFPLLLLAGVVVSAVWYATSREPAATADPLPPGPVVDAPAVDADDAAPTASPTVAEEEPAAPEAASIAIAVSEQAYPDGEAANVVLAREDASVDAAVAMALQAVLDAPLLLTSGDALSGATAAEVDRLGRPEVHILGGQEVLSIAAEEALAAAGHAVHRHAGRTGVETAVDVADQHFPEAEFAVLAPAFSTDPDAMAQAFAAGAVAAGRGTPVLLSDADALSPATAEHLRTSAISTVAVVGSEGVLAPGILDELAALGVTALRVTGDDAPAIAAAAAQEDAEAPRAAVIMAEGHPDDIWPGVALAGIFAGRHDAPVLLSTGSTLPEATRQMLGGGFLPDAAVSCMPGVDTVACAAAQKLVEGS